MAEESSKTHDVFLSYSSKDKTWADAACAVLERYRIRCWIAPRDVTPGDEWAAAIMKGLNGSRVMVLIFSGHANASDEVRREVERAASKGMFILPVRVEDVEPEGSMEYALGNRHWLDAFTPPVEQHLEKVAQSVKKLLGRPEPGTPGPGFGPKVGTEARRPRALWPVAIGAALVSLASLGVLVTAMMQRGNGEIKTTIPDKASTKTGLDGGVVEHKLVGDTASSSSRTAEPRAQAAPRPWVSLFSGKDLANWKTHPKQPGNWRIENGMLIGSSSGVSHLYTERGDYKDFHLLLEARVNDGGKTGVYFRAPFGPNLAQNAKKPVSPSNQPAWLTAYNAKIDAARLGGLLIDPNPELHRLRETALKPREWITLEVTVEGNHIVIKVDGQTTADYTDARELYTSGHIVLQQHGRSTVGLVQI